MFYGVRFGTGMLVMLYMVALIGAIMGADIGYTASNATAASVEYNGTHAVVGTGEVVNASIDYNDTETPRERYGAQFVPSDRVPSLLPREVVRPYARSFAKTMARSMFTVAFAVADVTATATYHLQWMPLWILNGVFRLAGFVPVVGLGYVALSKLQRYS